jgi:hypothetical protein
VAVGDFNGDGILDLAVANQEGTVSVLLGNGHGGFSPAPNSPIPVGRVHSSVVVGDFNGDGKLDLAVTNILDNTVSVLLGNGDGTFHAAPNSPIPVGSGPDSLAVADFNGDGILDLAVANQEGTVSLALGNGDGSFLAPNAADTISVGGSPNSIAVGDLNHDGMPDIVTANQDGTVSVLLNPFFSGAANSPIRVGADLVSVALGDFNQDNKLDIAVTDFQFPQSGTVSVLLGNGDGTFQQPVTASTVGFETGPVAVGDFNRDGIADLAVGNASAGFDLSAGVSVLLGKGDGTFQGATEYPVGAGVGSTSGSIAVGDFNRDGAADLAVGEFDPASNPNFVTVLLNQAPVTTTAVTASANPAVAGQPVTLTATVSQAVPAPTTPASLVPTGTVTFEESTTSPTPSVIVLGTATVRPDSTATFSTFRLPAGDHAITAVYGGDPNFDASTSPALNEVINQDATTTTLSVSSNPAVAGQPLTLAATVAAAAPGFGPPTGSVLFLDGSTTIGTGTLGGSGVATFTIAALPGGHFPTFSAEYLGDGNFTGSQSLSQQEFINTPAPVITDLDPSSVPEGSPDFTLTLNGKNFPTPAGVVRNGTPLRILANSATQIQVVVPGTLVSDEGTATVTIVQSAPTRPLPLPATLTITDAPLTASEANISVLGNKNFSGTVATFTDANSLATAADFKAIITWDNGTADFGVVTGAGPGGTGPFTVTGTHTFGTFHNAHTVSVMIFDKGGTSVTVTDNLIDPPAADPTPAPAGDPSGSPAVLPVDDLLAALEAAAQARHRHHPRPAGGHHPAHQPRRHHPA